MIERKDYIVAALKRRFGMSLERTAELDKFNDAQTDWTAKCPVCGAELRGTLAQLKEHWHGVPSS